MKLAGDNSIYFVTNVVSAFAISCDHSTLLANAETTVADAQAACTKEAATQKAHLISDQIAKINGINLEKVRVTKKISTDENYFFVTKSYDTGLNVPTYTVKLTKSSCFITDVIYSNQEG